MPLNQDLYDQLVSRFGRVKIGNPGVPMAYSVVKNPITQRNDIMVSARQCGEYYIVCCPYCKDNRFRLWINHRWGTEDPVTGTTFWPSRWAYCFNEGSKCDLRNFELELQPYIARGFRKMTTPVGAAAAAVLEFKQIEMPEGCEPLHNSRGVSIPSTLDALGACSSAPHPATHTRTAALLCRSTGAACWLDGRRGT
jgi:hypothetical protein